MDLKKAVKIFLPCAAGLTVLRSVYEIRQLKVTEHRITSEKISGGISIRIVFISDLHNRSYGKKNIRLLRLVKEQKPDLILLGGDMITAEKKCDDTQVLSLLGAFKKIAPVYYAMGNHEEYLKVRTKKFPGRYDALKGALDKANIPLLDNRHIDLKGNISIYGLELPKKYYRRFNRKKPSAEELNAYLGEPCPSRYNILLAHTPAFAESYGAWKGDLVLCGHYHGGIAAIPDIKKKGYKRGLISPGFKLFPECCAGMIRKENTDIIVSAGCGQHSINFRLFNKPEVNVIELSSEA